MYTTHVFDNWKYFQALTHITYCFNIRFLSLTYFFKLQLTFNIILYYFQMYIILIRYLYNLQSDPLKSSIHLALYIVIAILLTIFPRLYFVSPWLFSNYQLVLNPFTFSPSPPTSLLSGNHEFISVSMCFCFVCLFILFFRFHIYMKSYGIFLSFWLISLHIILQIWLTVFFNSIKDITSGGYHGYDSV